MLLRDCPVGSIVRLVSLEGEKPIAGWWIGEFAVFQANGVNAVKDGHGDIRDDVHDDEGFQFEIVPPPPAQHKTVYLKGKTYNLIPVKTSDVIEIDGVEYYMEEK